MSTREITMRARQKGITFIGWIVLLVPVAIVGYAAVRVVPLYLNFMKVSKALDQTATEAKGDEGITGQAIRNSLDKRFDIDSVSYPRTDQISVVREGKSWVIEARYEDVAPLFANISVLVRFDKRAAVN
jgi:hypothetical protein